MRYLKKFNESSIDLETLEKLKQDIDSIFLDVKDSNLGLSIDCYIDDFGPSHQKSKGLAFTLFPKGDEVEFELDDITYNCLKTIEDLFRSNSYRLAYTYQYFDPVKEDDYVKSCYMVDDLKKASKQIDEDGNEYEILFMSIIANSYK